jgi:hypothetical protein
VWGHAQLQEQLAGQLAAPAAPQAPLGRGQKQPQPIPYLQVGVRLQLVEPRARASTSTLSVVPRAATGKTVAATQQAQHSYSVTGFVPEVCASRYSSSS